MLAYGCGYGVVGVAHSPFGYGVWALVVAQAGGPSCARPSCCTAGLPILRARPTWQSFLAHNSFISVLVEEGLVGLWLYLTMLFSVFSSILRLPRLERRFGLVLLATLVTAMLPLTWEDQKATWFIMAAALIGMSALHVSGPRGAVRQPLVRRTAPAGEISSRRTTVKTGNFPGMETWPSGGASRPE